MNPDLYEVAKGERGMLKGIEVALKAECLVSAVTLIFSAIDALAALTRPIGQLNTKMCEFTGWSDRYLRPGETLGCSSTDLYAARCGVLHTYGSESRLAREGKARRLIYQWEAGPPADAEVQLPDDAVVVFIEALHKALIDGLDRFIFDAEMDPDTRPRVEHHVKSMLCYRPWALEAVSAL